jgi:hypothetical protein
MAKNGSVERLDEINPMVFAYQATTNVTDNLRLIMEKRSYTQSQVAEILLVNQSQISRWLRGLYKPRGDSLIWIHLEAEQLRAKSTAH